jgi:hypothetical protein
MDFRVNQANTGDLVTPRKCRRVTEMNVEIAPLDLCYTTFALEVSLFTIP